MAEDKFSIGQVLSHKLLGIMAEKGKLSFRDHISKLKRPSKVGSLVAMSHLFFFFNLSRMTIGRLCQCRLNYLREMSLLLQVSKIT